MVKLYEGGVYLLNGEELIEEKESARVEQITGRKISIEEARKNTIAYSILKAHNTSDSMENLKVRFDSMASHYICRNYSDGNCIGNGTFSPALRAYKLPQFPVCRRRYNQ